jgi:hypothetical protein
MNVTVSIADFNWPDTRLPNGLRKVFIEFSQAVSVTAPWKMAEASFQPSE